MIQIAGDLPKEWKLLVVSEFLKFDLKLDFRSTDQIKEGTVISFDKKATQELVKKDVRFYNWDLLFSLLGAHDSEGEVLQKLNERIKILCEIQSLKSRPEAEELHASIRVHDLAKSTAFYSWLFGADPVEWTHRYVIFKRKDIRFNFVLVVADGKELNHDTLYHLGMGVSTKQKVIAFYHSAVENGFHIEKPPRTTWRGTPLHEMWLQDSDGTAIEIYARLTDEELAQMPDDKEPWDLV